MARLERELKHVQAQSAANPDADDVFGTDDHISEYVRIDPDTLLALAAWGDETRKATWNDLMYEFGCKRTYLSQVWAILLELFMGYGHAKHVDEVLKVVQDWRSAARNNENKALY